MAVAMVIRIMAVSNKQLDCNDHMGLFSGPHKVASRASIDAHSPSTSRPISLRNSGNMLVFLVCMPTRQQLCSQQQLFFQASPRCLLICSGIKKVSCCPDCVRCISHKRCPAAFSISCTDCGCNCNFEYPLTAPRFSIRRDRTCDRTGEMFW